MKKLFTKEALQHAVENWRAGSQEPIECVNNIDYSTLREIKKEMWNKTIMPEHISWCVSCWTVKTEDNGKE